ncbi:MAG TPA: glycosyltransferase family 4 protein [Melioribacteraceae bacterium]|nr:glycosyltransferase family 4 protein [Melioribacteraceae bacterium]
MKIAWLCPYPINNIPEIRRQLNGNPDFVHSSSWIVTLSNELINNQEIELHILNVSTRAPKYFYHKIGHHLHVIPSGIPFIYKGFPSWLPIDRITYYKNLVKKFNDLLKDIKPNIVHGHGTEGPYGFGAVNSGVNSIVSIQGIISSLFKYEPSVTSWIQARIEVNTIRSGSKFGCRTNWDKSFVKHNNKNAQIFYLPEAVGDIFLETNWNGMDSDDIIVVGTICKRKGTELLLRCVPEIIKHFPRLNFKFVGGGHIKYLRKMKSLASRLGVDKNIEWVGYRNPSEIARLLSRSRLYLHPSYCDNSPNSLLEALAVGTPSLASNVGGIPSMVKNNNIYNLFDINDPSDLIDKLIMMLTDKEGSISKSNKSKQIIKENNGSKIVAGITIETYKQILGLN